MVPIEAGMRSIAVGGEAAWVLAGGKIARVDAQSGRAELLLDQAERTFALGFGRGYLWTLSRRDPFTNQHTVLARYSPDSPERPARLDVEGAGCATRRRRHARRNAAESGAAVQTRRFS
jgi:hypothetical protein